MAGQRHITGLSQCARSEQARNLRHTEVKRSFGAVDMNSIPSSRNTVRLQNDELPETMRPCSSHATKYNLSSNTETVEQGDTILFRRRDLEEIGQYISSPHGLIVEKKRDYFERLVRTNVCVRTVPG
jgi:hypothetical protein